MTFKAQSLPSSPSNDPRIKKRPQQILLIQIKAIEVEAEVEVETEVEETIEAEANIEEIGDMGLLGEEGALTRARMTDIGHK